jgi:hypothetical protein
LSTSVFLRCLGGFSTTFSIPWPDLFGVQLGALRIFSFDVFGVFKIGGSMDGVLCQIDRSFYSQYIFTMALLPGLALALGIAYAGTAALLKRKQQGAAVVRRGAVPSSVGGLLCFASALACSAYSRALNAAKQPHAVTPSCLLRSLILVLMCAYSLVWVGIVSCFAIQVIAEIEHC